MGTLYMPLGSRIIFAMYVTDGQTKATLKIGPFPTLHYIKSYLECQKSLGALEHYMRLKE